MSYLQGYRNPLLNSPSNRSKRHYFTSKGLKASVCGKSNARAYTTPSPTLSVRSVFKKSVMHLAVASQYGLRNKKIMPSSAMAVDIAKSSVIAPISPVRTASTLTRPIVHYNGPMRSLDEFPKETMDWLQKGAVAEGASLNSQNDHVVFKKAISQGKKPTSKSSRSQFVSKGLFYFRVLQITSKSSAKCHDVRCELEIENDSCSSELMKSTKCGKTSSQANFDETFLFDVEGPFIANLRVYCQSNGTSFLRGNKKPVEICLGKEMLEFDSVRPVEKRIHRIDLKGWPDSMVDNFQILVSIGLHVNNLTMAVVNQTRFHGDYITVYLRGGMTPRWKRYWAVLKGSTLQLFDFEYKEDRPPLAIIPLQEFLSAFHPSVEDDERQVDVGAMGLALQFSENCLSPEMQIDERLREISIFERRMYILADNMISLSQWKRAFEYISLVMRECRGNNPTKTDTEVLPQAESHSGYSGICQLYDPASEQADPTCTLFKYLW